MSATSSGQCAAAGPEPVADGSEAVGGPAGQADADAGRCGRGQVPGDEAADEAGRAEHHDVQGAGLRGEGHRSTLAARPGQPRPGSPAGQPPRRTTLGRTTLGGTQPRRTTLGRTTPGDEHAVRERAVRRAQAAS